MNLLFGLFTESVFNEEVPTCDVSLSGSSSCVGEGVLWVGSGVSLLIDELEGGADPVSSEGLSYTLCTSDNQIERRTVTHHFLYVMNKLLFSDILIHPITHLIWWKEPLFLLFRMCNFWFRSDTFCGRFHKSEHSHNSFQSQVML